VFAVVALVACISAREKDIVTYQADGDADAGTADARVDALDQAFVKAVLLALIELLDADTRQRNKAVLDREVLYHARLWVARFTVTREVVADDRKQVSVSVRVDRDKLRARLAELGISTRPAHGETTGTRALTVRADAPPLSLTTGGRCRRFGGSATRSACSGSCRARTRSRRTRRRRVACSTRRSGDCPRCSASW